MTDEQLGKNDENSRTEKSAGETRIGEKRLRNSTDSGRFFSSKKLKLSRGLRRVTFKYVYCIPDKESGNNPRRLSSSRKCYNDKETR